MNVRALYIPASVEAILIKVQDVYGSSFICSRTEPWGVSSNDTLMCAVLTF